MKARRYLVALAAAGMLAGATTLAPIVRAGSVIIVNETAQEINNDGDCSLQEAIYSANFDNNVAPDPADPAGDGTITTGCVPGNGDDVIRLAAGATYSMTHVIDDADNYEGSTATPLVTSTITIEGAGAVIERAAGAPAMRAFSVAFIAGGGVANLTLEQVDVRNFLAQGGDGHAGGGGGLGAGGAIYVASATLTIESSTFEGNGAIGGNGGLIDGSTGRGGGGGGFFGDGGSGVLSGSGGGGARGNGAGGGDAIDGGGGGGGTLSDGGSPFDPHAGGFACGGAGGVGDVFNNGDDGCNGGGGGGGGTGLSAGDGGDGGYGGGGGGGGHFKGDGGHGGFGGGGGGSGASWDNADKSDIIGGTGGDGGFGGGGGAGPGGAVFGGPGVGGSFAGDADSTHGGGGGALGGAVFGDIATISVRNSTFTGNFVDRGEGAGGNANQGADGGGAIFAVDGNLRINNATIAGNASTGDAGGVLVYKSTRGLSTVFSLTNSIVADDSIEVAGCKVMGSVSVSGDHDLYGSNLGCPTASSITADPLVKPVAIEAPGVTPTMAIDATSPAFDAGADATCEQFDQRGVSRPRSLHCDIGAYEYIKPSADLAVSTTNLGPAIAGQDLSIIVAVHNNGPTAAENVTLTDTLPTGTTLVSVTGGGGFNCTGTGPVTCAEALMLEGATALFTVTVHLPSSLTSGTLLTDAASVGSSKTPDPVPGNNAGSVTIASSVKADVSITKTGPTSPLAGTNASYTLTARNAGPSDAQTVAVSDTLPAGTTFQSLASPSGWNCTKPAVGASGSISCTKPTLASLATAAFTLTVRLAASAPPGSDLCNTASISTAASDPDLSNNTSSTCGSIQALADLSLTSSATTIGKPGKGTATFTVKVTNLGPSDATHVSLAATSSDFSGLAPVVTAPAGATCAATGQTVTCTWASIALGAQPQVTISIPWRSSVGVVTMTGTVTSGTPDPDPTNNVRTSSIGKK